MHPSSTNRNRSESSACVLTYEREDDEEDVEAESAGRGDEEERDGADVHDDGGDGDGEQHLDGQDAVDLADEGPPQARVLQHHWVQRPRRLPRLRIAGVPLRALGRRPEVHLLLLLLCSSVTSPPSIDLLSLLGCGHAAGTRSSHGNGFLVVFLVRWCLLR